jgi:enterobactin synthetase component D
MFESPFPSHVCFAAMHDAVLKSAQPHPEELASLSGGAVLKRRRAFAVGRVAARDALERLLLHPPLPVLPGLDREPCWPEGVVGSISHSGGWGLAAVDRVNRTMALGLDLEYLPELSGMEIASFVADIDELQWIGADPRRLLALFSAKESVYKALYPSCRAYFGFDAITARWSDTPVPGFEVALLRPLGSRWPIGSRLWAGVRWSGDFVLTWVWLPTTP